jgi:ferredoxin-NADP reductase
LAKAPAGQFCLELKDDRPVVLISAGVCITPMICMLNALTVSTVKRPVFFFHGTPKATVLLCSARPESDVVLSLFEESHASESKKTHGLQAATGLGYRYFPPQS